MTRRKIMQVSLLAGAVAAMLGTAIGAQAQSQAALKQQQTKRFQQLQASEAQAKNSGHYNAAYWKNEYAKNDKYWIGRTGQSQFDMKTQRAIRWQQLQASEAQAKSSGHYNAKYWNQEHAKNDKYWNSALGQPGPANQSQADLKRQRAIRFQQLQASEAQAKSSGHYNAAYWKNEYAKNDKYWINKMGH